MRKLLLGMIVGFALVAVGCGGPVMSVAEYPESVDVITAESTSEGSHRDIATAIVLDGGKCISVSVKIDRPWSADGKTGPFLLCFDGWRVTR